MNETENVSRRQFLAGGISVILGGVLGGLAGRVSAETELKKAEESFLASAKEKEWDRLPLDVLSGAVLDANPDSSRFGRSLLNKTGLLTQYVHVFPGLEVRLSRTTESGETVSWVGYDRSLSLVTALDTEGTENENGEAEMVLTIPEGLAFLRGSCGGGEVSPEVRVQNLAEYALRCGISRPDLTGYTEVSGLTLYPYARYDESGRFNEESRLSPTLGDLFFVPIGTDIIVTFRNANIAPFLHCGENFPLMDKRTVFSRCCGFGFAWYHCRTTEVCSWLGACYETFGGCARMLTTEELFAADPHLYIRYPSRAVPSREAARVRMKGAGANHQRLFTVVHLTDTHGDIDSTHAAYEYADQIGADFIAMSGDYVPFFPEHGYNAVHSLIRGAKTPTVYAIGNHDVWDYSDQKVYEECIAPIREVLQASEEHPYYYRDFLYREETVRVISLYPFYDRARERINGYYTQEQLDWLCETLATTPDGGHIMIIRHFFHHKPILRDFGKTMFYDYANSNTDTDIDLCLNMNEDPVPAIVDAYNKRESIFAQYTGELANDSTETVTVDYDFSFRPDSEFVAYFNGHVHVDAIGYARGTVTNQAVLCSTCTAGVKGTEAYHFYTDPKAARDYGTDTQIAFNVFAFDFRKKLIYAARVGNGIYDDKEKTWMELPY